MSSELLTGKTEVPGESVVDSLRSGGCQVVLGCDTFNRMATLEPPSLQSSGDHRAISRPPPDSRCAANTDCDNPSARREDRIRLIGAVPASARPPLTS